MTLLLLGLTGAAPGWADAGEEPSEHALRNAEERVLGADHAAEHARIRRAERRQRAHWRALSSAQRRRVLERRRRARSRIVASASAASPVTDGRWNGRVALPVVGTHAALLPTGKIMYFNRLDAGTAANEARAWLWDPSKPVASSMREVNPPIDPATGKPVNLFCAGQSLLADGQLLVTGGNLAYEAAGAEYKGLNRIYTFDPWTETWTEQPRMGHGRWYPTQTLLADGRTLITSGHDESGVKDSRNLDIELFNPPATRGGRGTVTKIGAYGALAGSPARPALYPHWFQMPSGNILNAGPTQGESWVLNVAGGGLSSAGRPRWARQHIYGTGVLMPGGPMGSTRVAQIGGYGVPSATPQQASAATEVFDEARPTTAPAPGPSLAQARAHHNTVLLPDGSMVSVGGGYGNKDSDLRLAGPEHLTTEIWDPATNAWRRGPAQFYKRAYHSTAVLLPDGRVVSAGDDRDVDKPGKENRRADVAEIYEPAYLFKAGPRPQITAAPAAIKWNGSFNVRTSSPITRAVLMAPSATTHANDMQQRHVELRITPTAGGATLVAPPNANVAPPGYYMLFGLSASGKPSVARWVKLGATASPDIGVGGDTTAPAFSIGFGSRKIRRVVRKGLRLRLTTNEAGTAKVKLTISRAAARKMKLRRPLIGRVKVGARTRVLPSGRSTFRVKLKAKARARIKKVRKLKLRVAVGLTDAAGNSTRHAKTLKLRR